MVKQIAVGVCLLGLLGSGCAQILGVQERPVVVEGAGGEVEPAVTDQVTGKSTTALCVEYCDTVEKNCKEGTDFQQYSTRDACINTCNALPAGEKAEPSGNTVACRLRLAKAASNGPGEFCGSAGPLGDDECGSNCEGWCTLLEHECPDAYSVLQDCEAACSGIPDSGNLSFKTSYPSAPDLQCRAFHLGAVADGPTHCDHAQYQPTSFCVPPGDAEPTCDEMCSSVMANCTGTRAVYESKADCLAACDAFPTGTFADRGENTVGCRLYHAESAATAPDKHCPHAGPSGDGHCGMEMPTYTGNCESYCLLFQHACPALAALSSETVEECAERCSTTQADNGAAADSGYKVETARDEASLQCRIYYLVKAESDELSCARTDFDQPCQ